MIRRPPRSTLSPWHLFERDRLAVSRTTSIRLAHGNACGGFVKAGAGHARLHQRRVNAERGDLLSQGFIKALNAPLGGMVERESGERHVARHARHLPEPPTT